MSSDSSNKIVVAFDLYGTLLSTESISDELTKIFGAMRRLVLPRSGGATSSSTRGA